MTFLTMKYSFQVEFILCIVSDEMIHLTLVFFIVLYCWIHRKVEYILTFNKQILDYSSLHSNHDFSHLIQQKKKMKQNKKSASFHHPGFTGDYNIYPNPNFLLFIFFLYQNPCSLFVWFFLFYISSSLFLVYSILSRGNWISRWDVYAVSCCLNFPCLSQPCIFFFFIIQ